MKIVILHDEVPAEAPKDVQDTLVSVDAIRRALENYGHEVICQSLTLNLEDTIGQLDQIRPDIVFNMVESIQRAGILVPLVPLLLEYLGIRYTGCRSWSMFSTSNKLMTKHLLKGNGLPTPDWYTVKDLKRGIGLSHGHYVIKSIWEDASIGLDEDSVILVQNGSDLLLEIEQHRNIMGSDCFAEKYVDGREFNISLLAINGEPEVMPPSEIIFYQYPEGRFRIVGYRAKWDLESFEYKHTLRRFDFPPSDNDLIDTCKSIAIRCWNIFSINGYARVDFRVDKQGQPTVLEINANPCLSPNAGFVAATERVGIHYPALIHTIVKAALYD